VDVCKQNQYSRDQVDLMNALRKLWIDHVMWTRSFILSAAFDTGDLDAVTKELLRNPVNFADALRPLYGDQNAETFKKLFSDHLLIAAQLVNAFKKGDSRAAQEQHKKWYANADSIARFLSEINPNWRRSEWQELLYDHLNMTEHEAAQILANQFTQSIAQYNNIENEALKMADVTACGIFRQFPSLAQSQRQAATMPAMASASMDADKNIFLYPQNLDGALLLIQQAVAGENEDRLFYSYLIEHAPAEEEKQIISGIRDNEIQHYGWFRQIYQELTGKPVPQQPEEEFTIPASFCDGLARALIGEQNAVQKYRKILYAMQSRVHINMLTQIITDEIRHGILYSYLFTKAGCGAK
jgi:rubrerythrin